MLGKAAQTPHRSVPVLEREPGLPLVQADYGFLCASYETGQPLNRAWATMPVLVHVGSGYCTVLAVEKKSPGGTSQAATSAASDKVMPVDVVPGVGAQFFETL